jgi:hypothetical protein
MDFAGASSNQDNYNFGMKQTREGGEGNGRKSKLIKKGRPSWVWLLHSSINQARDQLFK